MHRLSQWLHPQGHGHCSANYFEGAGLVQSRNNKIMSHLLSSCCVQDSALNAQEHCLLLSYPKVPVFFFFFFKQVTEKPRQHDLGGK